MEKTGKQRTAGFTLVEIIVAIAIAAPEIRCKAALHQRIRKEMRNDA